MLNNTENALPGKRSFGLSAGTIKIIALLTMTLDHIAWLLIDSELRQRGLVSYPRLAGSYYLMAYDTLYSHSYVFHIAGRTAFFLFAFFIVEGVHHTRSFRKYLTTVLLFAVLSEIPFNLLYTGQFFCIERQNVLFTMALCMTAAFALEKREKGKILSLAAAALCAVCAAVLRVDYGWKAVVFAVIAELFYEKKPWGFLLGCIFMGLFDPWELCGLLALPLIILYNGKRGIRLKYAFYAYYPVHILVIYAISRFQ